MIASQSSPLPRSCEAAPRSFSAGLHGPRNIVSTASVVCEPARTVATALRPHTLRAGITAHGSEPAWVRALLVDEIRVVKALLCRQINETCAGSPQLRDTHHHSNSYATRRRPPRTTASADYSLSATAPRHPRMPARTRIPSATSRSTLRTADS